MEKLIKRALLGDHEAAKRLTDAGVLVPCPVCSKQPKILRDIGYETSGFGAWCTIQCKPMFRKAHRKVESGKSTWERAEYYARLAWNTRAPILSESEMDMLEEKEDQP